MSVVMESSLSNLFRITGRVSRSISAENVTGEKGRGGMATEGTGANAARELGQKWKVSPSVLIPAHSLYTAADFSGEGAIRHIWATIGGPATMNRSLILRIYWDGSETPAVECPIGDFFAAAIPAYGQISSLAVCLNPRSGMNCYWTMPFRKGFRVTVENRDDADITLYYQIDYTLEKVPDDAGYFHAFWHRTNPLPYAEDYVILPLVRGCGQYVGTYMLWGSNSSGWWGEGEIKFYLDGDGEFPTICGTGTEDYFCGSYDFGVDGDYVPFTSPYSGMPYVSPQFGEYNSQKRFSLYRWHIADPVCFSGDIRVTIQALGWRSGGRYLPLQDDLSSVAYYYLRKPTALPLPLPGRDALELC